MADRYTFRADTSDAWASANPILAVGEPGFAVDTNDFRLGDGVHAWNDLTSYANSAQNPATIDDSPVLSGIGATGATLSSAGIIQLLLLNSIGDRRYADQVAAQAGGPRVVPVIQNPDGSWPSSTAGPSDISLYQGTVGFGAAPPAGPYDITALKDPS